MEALNLNIQFEKSAQSEERRTVTGWASVSTDANGMPVIDSQGDIIPVSELEKAVHEMAMDSGSGKVGWNHKQEGIGDLVESFVITKEKRDALRLGDGPQGWVVTFKVTDDETWQKVKKGEALELSIAGEAERVEYDA